MVKLKEIRKVVETEPVAVATVDTSGNPHVIAVAEARVIDDNKILITDNYMRQTKENINQNGKISLVVWDKEMKGYNIDGNAKYYDKGEHLDKVKSMKENKGMPAKGAIVVNVTKIMKSA